MLTLSPAGLYCPAGDFHVDPWAPVARAVVTHGHGDHARYGSRSYLATDASTGILRRRLRGARVETMAYGEQRAIGAARVSFHPAGHILGSAQVRVEVGGRVAVVSGDYKVEPDRTCAPFEPVRCDLFVTESTFGLPIYRWPDQLAVAREIDEWWRQNAAEGRSSLLLAYGLGKAQRLLAAVDRAIGPIYTHGAVESMTEAYREQGVELPPTIPLVSLAPRSRPAGALVVAPPSAAGSPWLRRLGDVSSAFASGWMAIRGTRRRRAVDRGFVVSDHADWPGLLAGISATGASEVWVTHGYREPLARWLREAGTEARVVATRFEGESAADDGAESLVDLEAPSPEPA